MKKFMVLMTIGAFLFSGALLHSCKKDEMRDTTKTPTVKPMLKDVAVEECSLPLMMGQTNYIGCVDIFYSLGIVYLNVDLNEDLNGFTVMESHLYYGDETPSKWQPGQFPYALDLETMSWSMPEEFECCEDYMRYFALHLQLEKVVYEWTGEYDEDGNEIWADVTYEESAWLLPADGSGVPFTNKKGQVVGWGQYFALTFTALPEIYDLDLLWSTDQVVWTSADPGFEMCLDAAFTYYYLDADFEVSCPLEDALNPFFLEPVEDAQFWMDWDPKGVNENSVEGTWQYTMWQIINGGLPMLYVKVTGDDETLIDGLMYNFAGVEMPLQINGDYTPGTYGFTGFLDGVGCDGASFTINLTVYPCP